MKKIAKKNDDSLAKIKDRSMSLKIIQNNTEDGGVASKTHDNRANTSIVYLLIDCSFSMSGRNKLQQAQYGAKEFVKEAQRKGYLVGIIEFSSFAKCLFDPQRTNRYTNLNSCIEGIRCSTGSTNMTRAVEVATNKLSSVNGSRVIVIATDGQPDEAEECLRVAEKAKIKGIEIIVIGTDDANIDFIGKLATSTELANKVELSQFKTAIASAANMLLALPSGE